MLWRATFNPCEKLIRDGIGQYRHDATRFANHGFGSAADPEHLKEAINDIRGVAGEMAIGKLLNLYVPFAGQGAIDVGDMVESRTCPFKNRTHGFLFVKPGDKNLPFVLVNCDREDEGIYDLLGYMDAQEAKDTVEATRMIGTKGAPRDLSHAIHHSELHPMEELAERITFAKRLGVMREPMSIMVQPTLITKEDDDYAEAV